jgi:hypothetical protein
MKKLNPFFLILSIYASASTSGMSAQADESESAPTGAASEPAANERNHDESWYWGFNLGGGTIHYKDAIQASVDATNAVSGSEHANAYVDGYFVGPLENRQTALGVSFGGIVDVYKNDTRNTSRTLTTMIVAFSAHHYFNSNFGDGLFARGDIGIATAGERNEVSGVDSDIDPKRGIGARLGLGYSILLSNETRLPVTVQWQHASIRSDNGSNALILTAGLMF